MTEEYPRDVVLEVGRYGRRPRYHRGAILEPGAQLVAKPEQCNTDQSARQVRVLESLPLHLPRPWTQLCRRCWRGTFELDQAEASRLEWLRERRLRAQA